MSEPSHEQDVDPSLLGQPGHFRLIIDIEGSEDGYDVTHVVEGASTNLERAGVLYLSLQQLKRALPQLGPMLKGRNRFPLVDDE